ncbi:hypothetical protein TNCV_2216241 [Trichonephila clavipes]|nr:hypothetical protein TNCV_2216241 [Trichonephila clavipes]
MEGSSGQSFIPTDLGCVDEEMIPRAGGYHSSFSHSGPFPCKYKVESLAGRGLRKRWSARFCFPRAMSPLWIIVNPSIVNPQLENRSTMLYLTDWHWFQHRSIAIISMPSEPPIVPNGVR